MTTATAPAEGRCNRCKQPRPVFPYKPIHDCIDTIGYIRLTEAADHLADIEDRDDRWCQAQIDRRPIRLCVPCHDREVLDEQRHIAEHEL
ncbi:hypothetical protein [Streptomyces sp. WMMC897]|uniref:hypothetical protein n=1 Tax=Streptomyces sp. WMMC897 TaxID=3014782 RepID=UPI0022B5FAD4|nr:hypothetical protein [Streptomyces sp. WMMC897]MCZ7413123.1 hypothetical protein [Streptomyces sp. WMMC897]MCZ7415493.1 hypothetical protein [Streptomyces sp. WMMC897]